MKGFYECAAGAASAEVPAALPGAVPVAAPDTDLVPPLASRRSSLAAAPATARIAVYDALTSSPRVEDISSEDTRSFIETLSERTYTLARERGGRVPYTVVREVAENLLHASFNDVVVSILDGGATIRFSDRGPGIGDKERAFRPGFTTADDEMRRFIRGVGSGLPIVRESIGFSGGFVEIEDNLDKGTVVTVTLPAGTEPDATSESSSSPSLVPEPANISESRLRESSSATDLDFGEDEDFPALGTRQKHVLSLVMEMGSLGPTIVSRELKVGLSTAYRDLAFLEEAGLLRSDSTGKRMLTSRGVDYLDTLTS